MKSQYKFYLFCIILLSGLIGVFKFTNTPTGKVSTNKLHTVPYEVIPPESIPKLETISTYKPKLTLGVLQETMCLTILIYGEYRGGTDSNMETVAWTAINRMEHKRYGSSICNVARQGKGSQFSSMKPYIKMLSNFVWGRTRTYTPQSAITDKINMQAWERASLVAKGIIKGDKERMHGATHFISFKNMKGNKFPEWLRYLKPVFVEGQGNHIYFTDNIVDEKGKMVYFTKEKPYNPKLHGG